MARRQLRNDLTGKRFGRLLVSGRSEAESTRRVLWNCACDCGVKRIIRSDSLTDGKTVSCGCWHKEKSTTHGMRNTIVYRKWIAMRQRCRDPKSPSYHNYGGRGITICERWDRFENFLEDMGLPPTGKHQPDRIDNDGNYEPGNVRWATAQQNANNRRDNVTLEYKGREQTLAQWADELGIGRTTLQYRISNGWSVQKAFTHGIDTGKGWRKGM